MVSVRVGVDTGGTFTDFVFEARGQWRIFKLASTPDDPSRAITEGLKRVAEAAGAPFAGIEGVHGTTVGTNALLQRRGARTALVTTSGFEDVIEIGRQARPELYNLNAVKPPPLVRSELRFGVNERVTASGEVLKELRQEEIEALAGKLRGMEDDAIGRLTIFAIADAPERASDSLTNEELAALTEKLAKGGIESIAISLLFSFVRPEHEQRLAEGLASLGIPLSVSHRILPEYREYERTSTVVVNAYLQPVMGRYLKRLTGYAGILPAASKNSPQDAGAPRLRVMQSSGGSISADAAAEEPVRTILSGPAGGVVGALSAARSVDIENIITFDMGGTSTDVALCDRDGMRLTNEAIVAGVPIAVPMMDIHTVGAGGGSIARVDAGGSLRVGPESAGADPGPACYGKSILPTVTDAHVVLDHFPGAALLGGEFRLDEARSFAALKQLAGEMSVAAKRKVSAVDAARGVLDIVNTSMERALRHISVERGHDPRDFTLVPFGGAGGLHAVELARSLRIPRVLLPSSPGALSAIGVVTADVVKDQSRTVMLEAARGVESKLSRVFREMETLARATLRREGFAEGKQRHERSLAVRYQGQSFEIEIKQTAGNIASAFHRVHQARYGYSQEQNVGEIVSARVRSIGIVEKSKARRSRVSGGKSFAKPHSFAVSYFERKRIRAAVYRREELRAGVRLRVPCIVTEYSATTLISES